MNSNRRGAEGQGGKGDSPFFPFSHFPLCCLALALVPGPSAPAATNPFPVRAITILLPSTYAGETYSGMTFDPRADGTLYLWPCTNCAGTGSGGTTFVTSVTVLGLTNLNSLTNGQQTFATGLGGSDFAISSSGSAHTWNLPTASPAARGALSSSDWATFNAKASTTYVDTAASNRVTVAAGTNAIVTTNSSAGVMTYTVAGAVSSNQVATIASNRVTVAAGSNVTVTTNSATGVMTYTVAGTGGSGSPGGAFPMLQFHDTGGVFSGTTNLTWDATNNRIGLALSGARPTQPIEVGGTFPAVQLGSTVLVFTNYLSSTGMVVRGGYATMAAESGASAAGVVLHPTKFFPVALGASGGAVDLGTFELYWRSNFVDRLESQRGVRVGATGADGIGFEYTNAVPRTNILRYSLVGLTAGQFLKVHSVQDLAGGQTLCVITNDF